MTDAARRVAAWARLPGRTGWIPLFPVVSRPVGTPAGHRVARKIARRAARLLVGEARAVLQALRRLRQRARWNSVRQLLDEAIDRFEREVEAAERVARGGRPA